MFDPKKSIDLYRSLSPGVRSGLDGVMKKAIDNGFTFGEPSDKDVEGLLQLQKDNFESYTVCPSASVSYTSNHQLIIAGMAGYVPVSDRCWAYARYPRSLG